jgi:hypothetical protein
VRSSAFSFVDEFCEWDLDAILAVGNPEPYEISYSVVRGGWLICETCVYIQE